MTRKPYRDYRDHDAAFKLSVVARMESGENITALSRELDIRRGVLNRWRDAFRREGPSGLSRPRGRPSRSAAAAAPPPLDELAAARATIAALERKVGRQALDLDFLRDALRHFETAGRFPSETGAAAPTPSSGRGPSGKAKKDV